jgi:hypothetical protein
MIDFAQESKLLLQKIAVLVTLSMRITQVAVETQSTRPRVDVLAEDLHV